MAEAIEKDDWAVSRDATKDKGRSFRVHDFVDSWDTAKPWIAGRGPMRQRMLWCKMPVLGMVVLHHDVGEDVWRLERVIGRRGGMLLATMVPPKQPKPYPQWPVVDVILACRVGMAEAGLGIAGGGPADR